MSIQKLSAVFNRQETPLLDFVPGLNIMKVPSQESASTWIALLRDMLYGPDPGGPPRSAASQGRLEAATPWGAVTILRWTASEDAPMSAFSAAYTGGAQPASYLTPANCGDVLIGIPQEAFDCQAIIGAPAPGDGRSALAELRALPGILAENQTEYSQLQARASQLEDQLNRHEAADRREAALAAENAHLDFSSGRDKVKTMEASKRGLPTQAELASLRASLDSLEAQSGPLRLANQRAEQAEKALRFAEAALEAQPQAEPPYEETEPCPRLSIPILCGALIAGLALGAAVSYTSQNLLAAMGGGLGLFSLIMLVTVLPLLRRQKEWDLRREEVEERRTQAGSAYAMLSGNAETARASYQEAQDARDAVAAIYQAGLSQILNGIRPFRPFAKGLDDARQAIADGVLMRRELDQALQDAEDARRRWDALKSGAVYPLPPLVRRPAADREALLRELSDVQARLEAIHAQFSSVLEEQAETIFTKLTQTRYNDGMRSDHDSHLFLAARLAVCGMTLPASAPLIFEVALDHLDGDSLTAALDILVELSQTRQILLLTSLDREVSCLRRTHPDRFHLIKL